ncbi:MAG: glycosyltransferase family 39 protein [Candidatus Latescibacterota bacterium]|nr:MAG: glycosyltransferase family 39 protein [Candidatus Latescibacterota bacterium]
MTREPQPLPVSTPKTNLHVLIAILLLALTLRLAAVLWLSDTVPHSDFRYYHLAGEKIASDWGFFFDSTQVEYYGKFGWWPPVYPFVLGAVYSLFGVDHRVVVFAQVALGTLLCWLVYRLGRRWAGERVGWIAALLVAVSPTYVFATNLLASENLFTLLLVLALLLATVSHAGRGRLAGAGVLFGLAALTRAIGLFVPFVVGAWLWSGASERRTLWSRVAWLLIPCAVTIAPWTLRNTIVVGTPAIICYGGGLNFYFGHNAEGIGYRDLSRTPMAQLTTQAAIDRMGYRLGFDYIAAKPLGFFSRAVRKTVTLSDRPIWAPHSNTAIMLPDGWRTDPELGRIAQEMRARQRAKNRWLDGLFTTLGAIHSLAILVCALATALLLWRNLPPEMRLMVYLSLSWVVAHAVFWAKPRFRYPMEIFLMLLAAYGLAHAHGLVQSIRGRRRVAPAPVEGRHRRSRRRR